MSRRVTWLQDLWLNLSLSLCLFLVGNPECLSRSRSSVLPHSSARPHSSAAPHPSSALPRSNAAPKPSRPSSLASLLPSANRSVRHPSSARSPSRSELSACSQRRIPRTEGDIFSFLASWSASGIPSRISHSWARRCFWMQSYFTLGKEASRLWLPRSQPFLN